MKIETFLNGISNLGFDAAPLIYFIEGHPIFAPLVRPAMRRVENGDLRASGSTLLLTEILNRPYQTQDAELLAQHRALLFHPSFRLFDANQTIADSAAQLRAQYRLKTVDAIHIATAIEASCDAFLTNDLDLKSVGELKILVLSELEI